jgi:hypothetical protein
MVIPFQISPSIDWSGWKDELGGVFRFNLEIHHLKPDLSGNLTEVSAMEPFFSVPWAIVVDILDVGLPLVMSFYFCAQDQ